MNPDLATQKLAESSAFGALCVVLLILLWWLIREKIKSDQEHAVQIERINNAHDVNVEKITKQFTEQIDKMNNQFIQQIDKMAIIAQADRKESTDAFNRLSTLLSNVIEKRGNVRLREDLT
jgi:hypothetical protein